jgi:inosine-uridine nucleoside N-ribohydrolase
MLHYHIDTDVGIDDGLAIVAASRIAGTSLRSLSTVFGNVPVETATRNALIFRRLLGPAASFEVFAGAASATDGFFRDGRHVHGDDGLGGATSVLGSAFLDELRPGACPGLEAIEPPAAGNVIIIGLGPTTNIPTLVARYGRERVERIVLLAGVVLDIGNITPFAEFNALCDPLALRATLALGIPVTLVPLDVCRKVQLARSTVISFLGAAPSRLARLIVASHMAYMDAYREREAIDGCLPHDTIAVMAAMRPEWFFQVRAGIDVDATPERRGKTSLALDPASHIEVVLGGELRQVRNWLGELAHVLAASG